MLFCPIGTTGIHDKYLGILREIQVI